MIVEIFFFGDDVPARRSKWAHFGPIPIMQGRLRRPWVRGAPRKNWGPAVVHWERGEPKSAGGGAREGVEKNYAERDTSKMAFVSRFWGSQALPRPRPQNNYMWISVLKHTRYTLRVYLVVYSTLEFKF